MTTTMGATVDQATYPGSTSKFNSAQIFDGYLGAPWAESMCKVYWTEGKWGQLEVTDLKGLSLAQNGVRLLVSLEPARSADNTYTSGSKPTVTGTTIAEEAANLATVIAAYQAIPAVFDVVLWQEMTNGGPDGAFPTAADYAAYVAYYQPVLAAAGVTHVYDPSMLNETWALEYYPGDAYCQKIGCDYYSEVFYKNGSTLTGMISIALNHSSGPVPFSVYEWGYSASMTTPTLKQFTDWITTQLQGPLLNYIQQGGSVDCVLWFGSFDNWNEIDASTPGTQIQAMLNLGAALTQGGVVQPSVPLPDYVDFGEVQGAANAISTTGVPLLSNSTIQIPSTIITVTGNQLYQMPVLPVTQLGYELQISASIGSTATVPFLQLELQWSDVLSGLLVADEKWGIPCGNGSEVNTIVLTGPTKGSQLGVQFKNLDPEVTVTLQIIVLYNSRVYAKDRALQVVTNNPPGYTYVGDHSSYGVIGTLSALTVDAGGTQTRLFPLYSGDVLFYMDQQGNGAANSTLSLAVAPTSLFGTGSFWSASPTGGVGNGTSQILRFPRSPVVLTYVNSGASNAVVNAKVIALDETR